MTERDAFILKQLKDNVVVYRGIFIVMGLGGVGAVVMAIVALSMGKVGGAISLLGMAVGFAISAMTARSQSNSFASALKEIGDEPDDLDAYHDYSKQTIRLIAEVKHPSKTFLQMAISYGSIALACLAGGITLVMLVDDVALIAFSSVLFAFAVLLALLTFNACVNWKTAKRLEAIE